MDSPFFTVIIPTYNRAGFLKDAIQSVLDQTFHDFELIIVNDRSTDNTPEIVRSFMNDERIKFVVNNRLKGGAGARNTGILTAQGEWIAFLDDDDIWLSEKLEKQFNKIQELDNNTGLIYAGYALYDFEDKRRIYSKLPEKEGWLLKDLLYDNYVTALCSVVVKTDILQNIGGFDERFPAMQDWDLYIRASEVTRFAVLKEVLVYVRSSNTDRISLNMRNKLEGALLIRQKFDHHIYKSPRLCHRIATITLYYSIKLHDWPYILKSLPWTFMGVFIDPYNFIKTMRINSSELLQRK